MIKPIITKRLLDHIKSSESCSLKAYRDSAYVWTIGYGHTHNVHCGDEITQEQADAFLMEDLHYAVGQVMQIFPALPQHRIDALADFVYNLGLGSLKSSTLLKVIKADPENFSAILYQFSRWTNCKGKRLQGLVVRRSWEAKCYRGDFGTD